MTRGNFKNYLQSLALSKKTGGFFLVEVVVVTAIVASVLIFLVVSIQDSVEVSNRALERTQAAMLLEEGAEAVKAIRSVSWESITTPTEDTTYYLSWTGSAWTLTTTPGMIDGFFTRTIVFEDVSRDANEDISDSGVTDDEGTRKATVTVTWESPSGTKTETLSFYLSDIL